MENSVILHLLEVEKDWNKWTEVKKEALAIQTIQEWICSANFKIKATHLEIDQATFIGNLYLKCQEEEQFWKSEIYRKIANLRNEVYNYWIRENWVYAEERKQGRPRRAEYSNEVLGKARKYLNAPFVFVDSEEETTYKNIYWKRSILGDLPVQTWTRMAIIKGNLFKHLYSKIGEEGIAGFTKEEIAEELKLPKRFVNELCRWLCENKGWEVVATTSKERKRRRVMRLRRDEA